MEGIPGIPIAVVPPGRLALDRSQFAFSHASPALRGDRMIIPNLKKIEFHNKVRS